MTLRPSRHNIISEISENKEYLVVNLLSGNADFFSLAEKNLLTASESSGSYPAEFIKKGYVSDPVEEDLKFRLKYIEFLEERDSEEIQLFFVPTYSCNFTCSYCYQSDYPPEKVSLSESVTDAFISFIEANFKERKKYITLFGGEPLLPGEKFRYQIGYFTQKAFKAGIDIAVVTNGYSLNEYLDLFDPSFTREIQITLDGIREIHDNRRTLKNGRPTFDTIVQNIDSVLKKGIPVNLRMVVDKENIGNLPELATFAIEKGWTNNPLFKTQIGRNYELHYCQNSQSKLFDRIGLYKHLYELIKQHPHILEFHTPAFSVMKFLLDNGSLPNALFDSCPACKSEWAMDFTGTIYSCTATVGKPGEKLGNFFPEVFLNMARISEWQKRDVMHIEECKKCNVQLVCGGGCGSIASNQHQKILSPDCRPVDELMGLGAKAYFK